MEPKEALEVAVAFMDTRDRSEYKREAAASLRRLIPFVEASLLYWQFVEAGAEHQRKNQGPLCLTLYRALKEGK